MKILLALLFALIAVSAAAQTKSPITIQAPSIILTNGPPSIGQTWTATSTSGAGAWSNTVAAGSGTNYPPITTTGTNIVVGTGVRKSLLMPTNASVAISFNGTEILGEQVALCITNTSGVASNLTISFFQDSAASTYFDGTVASNVSGFLVVSNSSKTLYFTYNGSFWRLDGSMAKEMEFAVSGGAVLTTNSLSDTVTLSTLAASNSVDLTVVSGSGGALTNFNLLATQPLVFVGAQTNISFRASMGWNSSGAHFWSIVATNLSATDRTLEFSSISNSWIFFGVYGTNAPSVMTNHSTFYGSGCQQGSNIFFGYTYGRQL